MDFLTAPWRSSYIHGEPEKKRLCFSDLLDEPDESQSLVLCRGRSSFAVLNRFPYSTAHTMVLPYKVTGDLCELSQQELGDLMAMSQDVVRAIREVFQPDAFNVGFNLGAAAGAGIPGHLHLHIVPRWQGDHNFMTVLGQTRVSPHEVATVWGKLHPLLTGTPPA